MRKACVRMLAPLRQSKPKHLLAFIALATMLFNIRAFSFLPQDSIAAPNATPVSSTPGADPAPDESDETPDSESKRILWIIPNYRTSPALRDYKPLKPRQKFRIAVEDSTDRGTLALAALFAGQAQLTNSTPSFGQGVSGYTRYLGTSYADFSIGNVMTEALYPILLHQDPRYFRHGTGTALHDFRTLLARSSLRIRIPVGRGQTFRRYWATPQRSRFRQAIIRTTGTPETRQRSLQLRLVWTWQPIFSKSSGRIFIAGSVVAKATRARSHDIHKGPTELLLTMCPAWSTPAYKSQEERQVALRAFFASQSACRPF